MLKINITSVGKIKDSYIREGILEFKKRLQKFSNFSIIEIQEEDENKGKANAINTESKKILESISKNDGFSILLDINGVNLSSVEMAKKVLEISNHTNKINFIIGGSNGVNDDVKKAVDFKLSFSKLTFPHQLMRLILTEQIYRWVSINNNIKYHK